MAKSKNKPASGKTGGNDKRIFNVIKKNDSSTRSDITTWKDALTEAGRAEDARQTRIQTLYDKIATDALLSSQIALRIDRSQGADFKIVDEKGKEDEAATVFVKDNAVYDSLSEIIIESKLYGCSVIEFTFDARGLLVPVLIPRRHVAPADGVFYRDVGDGTGIKYREMPEFGRFVVEFNYNRVGGDYGLLNKAVPHVLIKTFAQMCWSELCEIYGIPPRVLKTDTTNREQLDRAERMMKEIGAAAWFIIDTTEEFKFAENMTNTNGEVYKNLIQLCSNEISMLVTGAVLGQDTVNGNRSKEESSKSLADSIVLADQRSIELQFNRTVLPALAAMGLMREGLRLNIQKETDIKQLWDMTFQAATHFEIEPEWVKRMFGIEVTGVKTFALGGAREDDNQQRLGRDISPFV